MPELIPLLLTGLFGLAAGLGGVALQAHLQRRDKEQDRKDRRRDLLRNKAEEIFAEADIAVERMEAAYMQAIEDAHGIERSAPTLSLTPTNRLKALLLMYFPDSEALVKAYDDQITGISKQRILANEAAVDEPIEVRVKALRVAREAAAKEMMAATIELAGSARRLMKGMARSLE